MKALKPEERLIVAADFKPPVEDQWIEDGPYAGQSTVCRSKRKWVEKQVLALADSLKGTGVYLKVNSALRVCGYDLIGEIQSRGLRVFADLKLNDIPATLATDGVFLAEAQPELLTVMCYTGTKAMAELKKCLPKTEVLGVTVLTSLSEEEVAHLHGAKIDETVKRLALMAQVAGLDGLVSSAKELALLKTVLEREMTLNTPGIRPVWAPVEGDDQNRERVMTISHAIKAGATRIVIGRPIMQADDVYGAVRRTIDEIALATG